MTNWKALATGVDPPVREQDLDRIVSALEKLEAAFRVHQSVIPVDGLIWTGPEDPE
jgi:hypothetical protein